MGRQNEQGLDEGEGEREDHDKGYGARELASAAREHHPGCKEDHRGEDGKDDRLDDHGCAVDGGCQAFLAIFRARVDGFADNDRVVDDNADHQQEGEGGDHVERDAHQRQEREAAREGGADTNGDPDGDLRAQKQKKRDQYEAKTHQEVRADQADAAHIVDGRVLPDRHRNARRRMFNGLVKISVHIVRHFHNVHFRAAHDLNEDRALAVDRGEEVHFLEAINHFRHVRDAHDRPIGHLLHDDIFEIGLCICL